MFYTMERPIQNFLQVLVRIETKLKTICAGSSLCSCYWHADLRSLQQMSPYQPDERLKR